MSFHTGEQGPADAPRLAVSFCPDQQKRLTHAQGKVLCRTGPSPREKCRVSASLLAQCCHLHSGDLV